MFPDEVMPSLFIRKTNFTGLDLFSYMRSINWLNVCRLLLLIIDQHDIVGVKSVICCVGVNLLVGTENGLWLLDRSGQGKVYSLISRRRFQQMDVLEGLNVLITISGTRGAASGELNSRGPGEAPETLKTLHLTLLSQVIVVRVLLITTT